MADAAAAAERGTDLVTALPEDVLVEVFSRLRDVNALLRCAVTCRQWLRLFTDQDFLRRLWPQHDPLLGLFLNGPMQRHASTSPLTFLPSPVSPVDSVNGVPFSFVPDDSGIHYSAEHLASRRGILLVQFIPPSNLIEPQRRTRFRFGLCDPITGAHDVLPHLVCALQGRFENGYAILTADDFAERSMRHFPFSQLVIVDRHDDDDHLHVHAFSAATRSWSAPAKCLQTERVCLTGARAAVVHRGIARWLYIAGDDDHRRFRDKRDLYMLNVEVGKGRASSIKLPMRSTAVLLIFISRDETLSVACVQTLSIDVWSCQEGGDDHAAWRHARVIQIPSLAVSNILWSQRNMGTMLAMYGADSNNVLALDLETGVIEKVMDLSQCPRHNVYYKCLPYKRDLSEFFLRQLGGILPVAITQMTPPSYLPKC